MVLRLWLRRLRRRRRIRRKNAQQNLLLGHNGCWAMWRWPRCINMHFFFFFASLFSFYTTHSFVFCARYTHHIIIIVLFCTHKALRSVGRFGAIVVDGCLTPAEGKFVACQVADMRLRLDTQQLSFVLLILIFVARRCQLLLYWFVYSFNFIMRAIKMWRKKIVHKRTLNEQQQHRHRQQQKQHSLYIHIWISHSIIRHIE